MPGSGRRLTRVSRRNWQHLIISSLAFHFIHCAPVLTPLYHAKLQLGEKGRWVIDGGAAHVHLLADAVLMTRRCSACSARAQAGVAWQLHLLPA